MMPIIRLAAAVAALGLLSSIPAAGQAKLSTQQLNSPTLNVNKPIAAPNKPITVLSPNGNKLIAAPKASGTSAFQRPVVVRDTKTRAYSERNFNGPPDPNLAGYGGLTNSPAAPTVSAPGFTYPPCPGGTPRSQMGYC
jgi:hypothetical protein